MVIVMVVIHGCASSCNGVKRKNKTLHLHGQTKVYMAAY